MTSLTPGLVLPMVSGQTKEITCLAEEVYPRPTFIWRLGGQAISSAGPASPASSHPPPLLSLPRPPTLLRSPHHYWFTSSSSLLLTPSLEHHNSSLSCTILPSHSYLSLLLEVHPLLPSHLPLPASTFSPSPLIPLLLLAATLLLGLVICILLTSRSDLISDFKLLSCDLHCEVTESFSLRRRGGEDPKEALCVTGRPDDQVISYLLLLLLVCQVVCSPESMRTASELVEQLEDVVSVIGRSYRGSLRSRVGECEEESEQNFEEKEEMEQKEQVEASSDKDNDKGEDTMTSSASMCSHCSSLPAQASRQEDASQLGNQETLAKQNEIPGEFLSKRLSLFECQEGCFSSSPPHTQQRVVIPSFQTARSFPKSTG